MVATIILADGAWADGSSWNKVIRGLRIAGLRPVAAPLPLTSLTDDVAPVERTIERVTALAPNATADEQAVLFAVQRPIAVPRISTKVGSPLWRNRPSWFLLAEEDHMIVPPTRRFTAERMNATIRSHNVDHTPSVTAPDAVVDIIREAIHDA